jgi:O-succinylbenzoic acid--CoA ligase
VSRSEKLEPQPGDLVAAYLPPGPAWVRLVADVWDAGAALLPLDVRSPDTRAVLERAGATILVDDDGPHRLAPPTGDRSLALVVATSGTSGEPKLVELSRTAVRAAVEGSAESLGSDPEDPWLSCLPPAHIGGLLVLLRAALLGAPVIVHPGFDPEAVTRERAARFVSVVPTMLGRLVRTGVDLSGFRAILVGGAELTPDLRTTAERAGARIVHTYGLSESCGGVVYEGRPFRGTRVSLDPATSEILLEGPTLMRGYRWSPDDGPFTADGKLRTGDAGRIDDDGRLRVEGRLDDLIVTGGEKVWPEEVESALRSHPKVADVAVAGRPDDEWGRRVTAFVVPADAADPPTLDELRDAAAHSLARFKAPRELVLVDRLPRTPSGKVLRSRLAARP